MQTTTIPTGKATHDVRNQTGWCLIGCLPPSRQLMRSVVDCEAFVIGRRPGVNLQVHSPKVSGRHAELLTIGHCLFIRDLGSTNGTYVNRRRIRQPTPLVAGDHIELADVEFRVELDGGLTHEVVHPQLKNTCQDIDTIEDEWVLSQLDRLIRERAVTPHYQPIVSLIDSDATTGYEALARSKMCGFESPFKMFETARIANREVELSLVCRQRAIEIAPQLPARRPVFVNTHPTESFTVDVLPSVRNLRRQIPDVPMVVEVHEAAVHDAHSVREFRAELKDLDVQLAYDDFGAGRSRLMELVKAPPDYLKFDASMIRNVDQASTQHWRMIKTLVELVMEFDTRPLAEGIETTEEVQACRDLGFTFAQGYYFGRPADPKSFAETTALAN
ncbi:MAG: EAL domain-containing protein [Planctomyces sp.]|nr:EAL domain-containing protein [Planctomyces sp.]